ncbi:MAG: YkgJ family cysteine cluster protein [Desulfobacterota bacterium]|nr:YkgJ family cysteine cluster protein [Thermodesulfobacteriota bacterium]MDW8002449.1 YkgJ family cysteine cluster protein [Deltaproteobacteria bacterium]
MHGRSFLEYVSLEVLKLYEEIDEKIALFKSETGIDCVRDCGECCWKGRAKMVPLEFLPLAFELFRRELLFNYIDIIKGKENDVCVFYRGDLCDPKKGFCSFYRLRAATCRLYGFGFKRNKYGFYEPVMCDYLKERYLRRGLDLETLPLVDYDSIMIRLVSLCFPLGLERYPVNQAILVALNKVAILGLASFTHDHYEGYSDNKEGAQCKKNRVN